MEIEIGSVSFAGRMCRTRIPFRFGVVTLIEAPVLTARVGLRVPGAGRSEIEGFAADLAVPKWFDKNPARSSVDDMRALLASAERAGRAAVGRAGSAFAIWQGLHSHCLEHGSGVPLVDGFGVALVERALLDAACRAARCSFRAALERDLFHFDPGALLPETAGLRSPALLANPAPEQVLLRHTVGGLDPLRSAEVPGSLRGDDDHPVALEEDIARYGLRAFKLKAGGDPESDVHRLSEIARVVAEAEVHDPIFSLDANEQYPELDSLGALLEGLDADPDGRRILAGLRYIEQPLPRARTFDPASEPGVRAIAKSVPLLIDEADDRIDAFERALALGYRGVSVKNCKGVFRALANRALCVARSDGAFQTSEDLTNLPVLPLQQDLATLAALGLEHSERNGHHFFPGLDVLSAAEAEAALQAQPDLYERRGDRIVLRIRRGAISLQCQHATGYGYASPVDWDSRSAARELDAQLVSMQRTAEEGA